MLTYGFNISCSLVKQSNNMFYGFSSMKCATSGIFPVNRREQNEVDDFYKSTSHDSPNSVMVFYFFTIIYSKVVLNLSEFLSSAERKCYFEEQGKPKFADPWWLPYFSYYQSQCGPATVWLPRFTKISYFVFSTRNKWIQVWDNMRVSK